MAIDLLFTDVVMPGPMKSPELARQARERLPDISVLFTSGYTENSIVHSGRLDEGVELLSKPYTREALARKIRYVLSKDDAAGNEDGNVIDRGTEATLNQAEEPRAHGAAAEAPVPPAEIGVKTILVCEDDWLIRASTVELLEDLGHSVIEAADAKSALAALSERHIDILVTDVGLPDMSGIMLAERARAILPSLPVIYATGHSNHEGIEPGPGVQLVVKPYSGETLAAAIAAVSRKS